jgi:hypothetical protein
MGSPPPAKIGQIAAFAMTRGTAFSVVNAPPSPGSSAQFEPPSFFGNPTFRAVGITEKKDFEFSGGGPQLPPQDLSRRKYWPRRLVVHGQNDRGAGRVFQGGCRPWLIPRTRRAFLHPQGPTPQQSHPTSGHNWVEQKGKKNQLHPLKEGKTIKHKGPRKKPDPQTRARKNGPKKYRPA